MIGLVQLFKLRTHLFTMISMEGLIKSVTFSLPITDLIELAESVD